MDERLTALVGARITEFQRKMAEVNRIAKRTAKDIVVRVEARTDEFDRKMSRVASSIRTVQTISGNTFRGIGISISSAAVPAVASLAGALGSLGPILGTVAGASVGLGAAFGVAGVGVAAFAGVATSSLGEVFEVQEELNKLEEKLARTDDLEERTKIYEEMAVVQGLLDKEQVKAQKSLQSLSDTWNKLAGRFRPQVIEIFTESLSNMEYVLGQLEPMFDGVVRAYQRLSDSLTKGLRSEEMTAVFETLNETAGSLTETLGKAIGYFGRGFLNMLSAFAPLSKTTADGFLNMAISFDKWANNLWKSEKFEKFIAYVQRNGPKLNKIVGKIVVGLVGMFSAFAPLAEDMTDSLVILTDKFAEWGQTLSDSRGFQDFVDYVSRNGPQLLSTLGELAELVLNIAIALAPLGEEMLKIIDSFAGWLNTLMETNPWLGKIIAYGTLLAGIFVALTPNIIAISQALSILRSIFVKLLPIIVSVGRFIMTTLVPALGRGAVAISSRLLPAVLTLISTMGRLGITFLTNAARMAAAWLIAIGPVGWVIAAVVGLVAVIIMNWDTIRSVTVNIWSSISSFLTNSWSNIVTTAAIVLAPLISAVSQIFQNTVNAGRQIFNTFSATLSTIWSNLVSIAGNVFTILKNVILAPILLLIDLATGDFQGFQSHLSQIWNNIVTAGSNIFRSLQNIVVSIIAALVSSGLTLFRTWAQNITILWNGLKGTASNIFNGIRNTVISIIVGLVTSVVSNFQSLVNGVTSKMIAVSTTIIKLWNKAQSFLKSVNLVSIGKNIIQGLVNGISSMTGTVISKAKSLASGIKNTISGALNIHSPSRWMIWAMEMVGAGGEKGLDNSQSGLMKSAADLASSIQKPLQSIVMPTLTPNLAGIEPQRTSLAFDTSLSSSDFGRVQHDFGAQMDDFELPEPTIIVNGNVDKQGITWTVENQSARNTRLQQGFTRKGG